MSPGKYVYESVWFQLVTIETDRRVFVRLSVPAAACGGFAAVGILSYR